MVENTKILQVNESGILASYNQPFNYPPGLTTQTLLKAPLEHSIQLSLLWMDIENSTDCQADHLLIKDEYKPGVVAEQSKKFCGQYHSEDDGEETIITSYIHLLTVQFSSDFPDNTTDKGYVLQYTVIPGER